MLNLVLGLFIFQLQAQEHSGFKIKTNFEYQNEFRDFTFILDQKNKSWTTLTEPKNGVALLGRLTPVDSKSVKMDYIVVDTTQKNAVISTPQIISRLGEPATLEVDKKMKISVLIEKTNYKIKN